MIKPSQIRAGRALLNWSAMDLADQCSLSLTSVERAETADGPIPLETDSITAIITTLRQTGVVFLKQD
ncbi:MAG: transcriptional regulator, partial [Hyphomicrobiales bacterium]